MSRDKSRLRAITKAMRREDSYGYICNILAKKPHVVARVRYFLGEVT